MYMPGQKKRRLHGAYHENSKMWILILLGSFLCLTIWAESLGDGWISTDQKPERESWKYRIEMIIGGY